MHGFESVATIKPQSKCVSDSDRASRPCRSSHVFVCRENKLKLRDTLCAFESSVSDFEVRHVRCGNAIRIHRPQLSLRKPHACTPYRTGDSGRNVHDVGSPGQHPRRTGCPAGLCLARPRLHPEAFKGKDHREPNVWQDVSRFDFVPLRLWHRSTKHERQTKVTGVDALFAPARPRAILAERHPRLQRQRRPRSSRHHRHDCSSIKKAGEPAITGLHGPRSSPLLPSDHGRSHGRVERR